jgi:type II secretory pathway component PulK
MNPPAAQAKKSSKRRGIVIVAVLVVVAVLALAGYHYTDMMTSEFKASEYAHRNVQARRLAESGVHYAAALVSIPDNYDGVLNGQPFNNPDLFRDIVVRKDDKILGHFSIIAPADADSTTNVSEARFGVSDESGKINLNALMKLDQQGQLDGTSPGAPGDLALSVLKQLPNMTDEIAAAIIDWMDPDSDTRPGGAENDYYSGLNPPYRCKNGPLDSIDEILFVKGVTRELLYGTDHNRNGIQDEGEVGSDGFSRGWSAFLTVHSREPNSDRYANPYIFLKPTYLSGDDLKQFHQKLTNHGVSVEVANFLVLYGQYGPYSESIPKGSNPENSATATISWTKPAYNFTKLTSFFNLVDAKVRVAIQSGKKPTYQYYDSPLADAAVARDQLGKLFACCTLLDPETTAELPARVNINTAPVQVLAALPGLRNDAEKIVQARQAVSGGNADVLQSPAWLYTEAKVRPDVLKALDNFITTRTQVYRVQSVGYLEGKGTAIRVEAVIDANWGRPRIIHWRDLTELGKGLNIPAPQK